MDSFKRALSFKTKKKRHNRSNGTESTKPFEWHEDERNVREGQCCFQVKYLGCVEVFESRGMHVCEEAVRILRTNAKKAERFSFRKKTKNACPVLALLYVSGDSLRVVENKCERIPALNKEDKGLLVDQTIEKVSFCAPDRNYEKGFAYICRDGTTKRWMCHGFMAIKESGERLSHAVGCAFAVCLEKKQQRERDAVSVCYNADKTSFTRTGSFKQASLTERMQDPQSAKIVDPVVSSSPQLYPASERPKTSDQVDRPRPSDHVLNKIEHSNDFPKLSSSPFKRNASLRLNELPSTLQRQSTDFTIETYSTNNSLDKTNDVQTVEFDPIAAMCQKLTEGLSTMTDPHGPNLSMPSTQTSIDTRVVWPTTNLHTTNPFYPLANLSNVDNQFTQNTFTPTHRSVHSVHSLPGGGMSHTDNRVYSLESSVSLSSTNPFDTSWANKPLSTNPFLGTSAKSKQEFVINM